MAREDDAKVGKKKMHRYSVKYIEREGNFARRIVIAVSKGEAKRIAADQGCEDIISVKRAGFPWNTLLVVSAVVVIIGLIIYMGQL